MRLAGEKLPCQRAIGSPLLERVPRWPFFCFNFLTACAWTAVLLHFRFGFKLQRLQLLQLKLKPA